MSLNTKNDTLKRGVGSVDPIPLSTDSSAGLDSTKGDEPQITLRPFAIEVLGPASCIYAKRRMQVLTFSEMFQFF